MIKTIPAVGLVLFSSIVLSTQAVAGGLAADLGSILVTHTSDNASVATGNFKPGQVLPADKIKIIPVAVRDGETAAEIAVQYGVSPTASYLAGLRLINPSISDIEHPADGTILYFYTPTNAQRTPGQRFSIEPFVTEKVLARDAIAAAVPLVSSRADDPAMPPALRRYFAAAHAGLATATRLDLPYNPETLKSLTVIAKFSSRLSQEITTYGAAATQAKRGSQISLAYEGLENVQAQNANPSSTSRRVVIDTCPGQGCSPTEAPIPNLKLCVEYGTKIIAADEPNPHASVFCNALLGSRIEYVRETSSPIDGVFPNGVYLAWIVRGASRVSCVQSINAKASKQPTPITRTFEVDLTDEQINSSECSMPRGDL